MDRWQWGPSFLTSKDKQQSSTRENNRFARIKLKSNAIIASLFSIIIHIFLNFYFNNYHINMYLI